MTMVRRPLALHMTFSTTRPSHTRRTVTQLATHIAIGHSRPPVQHPHAPAPLLRAVRCVGSFALPPRRAEALQFSRATPKQPASASDNFSMFALDPWGDVSRGKWNRPSHEVLLGLAQLEASIVLPSYLFENHMQL